MRVLRLTARRCARRGLACALALMALGVPAALAQPSAGLPRVVLESADRSLPPSGTDVSELPAAWRVRLAPDPLTPDADLSPEFDARAPRADVWLTVRVGTGDPATVPTLATRLRDLVRGRPSIRVLELDVSQADTAIADFVVRRIAVDVRAARDDIAIAMSTSGAASELDRIASAGLAPLIDLLALPPAGDPTAVRARLAERSLALRVARLDVPLTGDAAETLASLEIDRLGDTDIAGYAVSDAAALPRLVTVLRSLSRVLAQELTRVDADVRVTAGGTDQAAAWQTRVLFGVESLATFVTLDVPDATREVAIRLVLPVAGSVVLLDPVRGREFPVVSTRDDEAQTTTATLAVPSAGRWLLDFNRDADGSFVQRENVAGVRRLTLDEILARHQTRQAADRLAVSRYIADGTMQQYFRPTVTDPGFDVFTENRYYVDEEGLEWEELSFSVNGAKWDENRPPFPLLQPEKVLSPPLVVELDARYRYRLAGMERVDGIECYVVRFDPIDSDRSLYRGSVWIAAESFARVKQQVVQTNLSAPVVSNDETQTFAPVRLANGRDVFLPSRLYNQQLVLIAGRNLLVERRMTFTNYVTDPGDFDARRTAARRSDRLMFRDTDAGVRDYVKDGDTRVVSDRSTTRAKAQAIGVTIDPSYDFPLPIFGINYLNFEFLGRKDTQLALLFAGVLAAGNIQRPQLIGRKVDLNVDFFAIAAPGSDRFYVPEGEREGERLLTWPLSTGVNLGFQATSYQKVTGQYQFRFDGFVRDRTTDADYTTPSSTVTNGLGLLYEYRRAGYNVTASGLWARRASWRQWGAADALASSSPAYEKFALNATKTVYFGPFSKVVVNGAWFTGRRLDRFSRYQFGLFDETRIRGVPSSGVRYGELAMARGQYSFNLFEQYRLDLFLDRAWGRTRDIGVPWEGITGIGAAVNVRIPGRNLILRADVGKSFLPDRYRRLGSTVVQILFLRPLN